MDKFEVEYLEKLYEAREKVNELTGIAPTSDDYKLLSKAFDALDKLLSPICSKCLVRAKRFITSPNRLYDSAMAMLPGGTKTFWTGDWYCPSCQHIVGYGQTWWRIRT